MRQCRRREHESLDAGDLAEASLDIGLERLGTARALGPVLEGKADKRAVGLAAEGDG